MSATEDRDSNTEKKETTTTYKVKLVNISRLDITNGNGKNLPYGFIIEPPEKIEIDDAGIWSFNAPLGLPTKGFYKFDARAGNQGSITWDTDRNPVFEATPPSGHQLTLDDRNGPVVIATFK